MSMLQRVFDRPGVDYVEVRNIPYFNKYSYRATLHIFGIRRYYKKDRNDSVITKFNEWKNENFSIKKNCKIRIEGDSVSVFSNDLDILLSLNDFYDDKNNVIITQTIHNPNYREIKYFVRQPKHKYRMYLKSTRITTNVYNAINSLIQDHKDDVYPSYPLTRALRSSLNRYLYDGGCYIDLDDEGLVTFILLKYDYLFNKVLKLEKLPEIKEKINTL